MKKYIGGRCPCCETPKIYGLCPNKECDMWTFGNNIDDYDMFFKKAKDRYSKTDIRIKGKRNYHASKSWCPTCRNTFMFKYEPTICENCEQKLTW